VCGKYLRKIRLSWLFAARIRSVLRRSAACWARSACVSLSADSHSISLSSQESSSPETTLSRSLSVVTLAVRLCRSPSSSRWRSSFRGDMKACSTVPLVGSCRSRRLPTRSALVCRGRGDARLPAKSPSGRVVGFVLSVYPARSAVVCLGPVGLRLPAKSPSGWYPTKSTLVCRGSVDSRRLPAKSPSGWLWWCPTFSTLVCLRPVGLRLPAKSSSGR
jgi:hypothetical protein